MSELSRNDLRLETGVVAATAGRARQALTELGAQPPRAGDLLLSTDGGDVQWCVVEVDSDRGLHVVPVDGMTWAGPRDVAGSEAATGASLVMRCAHSAWVSTDVFDPPIRSGLISDETHLTVRRHCDAVRSGDLPRDLLAEEIDHDPEYEDWIESVVRPARSSLLRASELAHPQSNVRAFTRRHEPSEPVAGEPSSTPKMHWYRLAATGLLVASLGLAGGLYTEHTRRTTSEQALRDSERAVEEVRQEANRWRQQASAGVDAEQLRERLAEKRQQLAQSTAELSAARSEVDTVRAQLEEASASPPLSKRVSILQLSESRLRSDDSTAQAVSRDESRFIVHAFVPRIAAPFERYRLQFYRNGESDPVWTADGLPATSVGGARVLTPEVPMTPFASGAYTVEVYGVDESSAELLGEFSLDLELTD